jgi:hypothetical protein
VEGRAEKRDEWLTAGREVERREVEMGEELRVFKKKD